MKKRDIFYTLAIFIMSVTFSCNKQIPKAKETHFVPTDDTVYEQAQKAIYSDALFARRILEEAMRTRPVQDSVDWYILYNLYIKSFLTTSEFDTILPLSRKVEQFCARQKQLSPVHYYLLADMNNNIGSRYAITGMNDSALKYFKQMLVYGQKTHNNDVLLTGYTNLADVHIRSGRYDLGAWYYR